MHIPLERPLTIRSLPSLNNEMFIQMIGEQDISLLAVE